MAQPGQNLRFPFKCLPVRIVVEQGLFEGNIDAQAQIAGVVDSTHPTFCDLRDDTIPTL